MNSMHFSKISTLTKHLLGIFVVSFMFGSSMAMAKVTKPAFAQRFEKRSAYKHRGASAFITRKKVAKAESKKPAFTERFDKRIAKKHKGGSALTVNQSVAKTKTKSIGAMLAERYDMRKAYKHKSSGENVNMIAAGRRRGDSATTGK